MVRKRFQIGLEQYEFARFAALQAGRSSPEFFLEHLLSGVFSEDHGGRVDVVNTVTVLKNARCSHDGQTLESRCVFVALNIPKETWWLASRHYADDGYFDALDFLHGLLNMALTTAMHNYDRLADRLAAQTWRPYWLQDWLGKIETEAEWSGALEDLDEDFPF